MTGGGFFVFWKINVRFLVFPCLLNEPFHKPALWKGREKRTEGVNALSEKYASSE